MFARDLSTSIPLYGQEVCNWCGAASAQMSRNGYPNVADRLYYSQLDLWNTIQMNNSTDPADSAWATDPHGLRACLQALNNPAGVHWSEFADSNRDTVLFDILYWMNQRHYPSPVLINQGGHWVVIVGFETDVEPLAGTNPVLQSISVNDPEPHDVGTFSTFSGSQWFDGPWIGPIIYPGTWLNKYVAIVEPPVDKGGVRATRVKRTGTKLLSPAQAVTASKRVIADRGLGQQGRHALFGRDAVVAGTAMLVREEDPRRRPAKSAPHYYIVPFGFPNEHVNQDSTLARGCVLVNAYTGEFEEVTTFGRPLRYLPEQEAVAIVGAALRLEDKQLKAAKAALMFWPGDITHVRTYPFWRVEIGGRVGFVDQLGKLYVKFLPSIPGD